MVVSVANTRGPSTGPGSATDPISDEQPRVTDHPGLDWLAEFGDLLYGYAMARVADPEIAADLVQETFVAAVRGQREFRGDSSRSSWLIGILKHKIIDHFRAAARQFPSVSAAELSRMPRDDADARPGSASQSLENQEFWRIFDECRSRLPGTLAGAFTLREIDRLSSEEVCKILHISSTNLSVRVHRARSLLRECLDSRWFAGKRRAP